MYFLFNSLLYKARRLFSFFSPCPAGSRQEDYIIICDSLLNHLFMFFWYIYRFRNVSLFSVCFCSLVALQNMHFLFFLASGRQAVYFLFSGFHRIAPASCAARNPLIPAPFRTCAGYLLILTRFACLTPAGVPALHNNYYT